jgi:hypothetical protein
MDVLILVSGMDLGHDVPAILLRDQFSSNFNCTTLVQRRNHLVPASNSVKSSKHSTAGFSVA